jgi:hypothetical protein
MTIEIINQVINQDEIASQSEELVTLVTRHTDGKGNGVHKTQINQLEFMRESSVSAALHCVYEPILGIVVQGKKAALLGEETYRYGAAQYLAISVDLPIGGFVVEATPDKPYLGFKLNLDPRQLCDIITAQTRPNTSKTENPVRGLFVSNADAPMHRCLIAPSD